MSESQLFQLVMEDAGRRLKTDRRLSRAWVFLPLVQSVLLTIGIVIVALVFVEIFRAADFTTPPEEQEFFIPPLLETTLSLEPFFVIYGLTFGFLFAYLLYRLVKRRNDHFSRVQVLLDDLIRALKAIAAKRGVNLDPQTNLIEWEIQMIRTAETEKRYLFWPVLVGLSYFVNSIPSITIIGAILGWGGLVAWLYMLHFLTKDFFAHEKREELVLDHLNRALEALGLARVEKPLGRIRRRRFGLYFLLSILTLGFFWVYWIFLLTKEPNEHFERHAIIENSIINILAPAVPPQAH